MSENEKKEEIKLSYKISNDGEESYIFNEASEKLESKTNFYETGLNLSNKEKKELMETIIKKLFSIVKNREELVGQKLWSNKCIAFKEAYACETKKAKRTKTYVTWLLSVILELSEDESEKRFNLAQELMSHPDFKDKEDLIVEKIYLNETF